MRKAVGVNRALGVLWLRGIIFGQIRSDILRFTFMGPHAWQRMSRIPMVFAGKRWMPGEGEVVRVFELGYCSLRSEIHIHLLSQMERLQRDRYYLGPNRSNRVYWVAWSNGKCRVKNPERRMRADGRTGRAVSWLLVQQFRAPCTPHTFSTERFWRQAVSAPPSTVNVRRRFLVPLLPDSACNIGLCDAKYRHGIELGHGAFDGHPHFDGTIGGLPKGFGAHHDL